ncbi:efflux RND transporter periplasmic adaptor subunit [Xanthobacter autotrophicus]|uniref:HlyD family secretion protein n=1 Tax=Xanthobacter autotrophicus TaxID=280 RepID=UPI001E29D654|nr:efflux RND transporter periplasmic adaptor subunit [Xanthobacter autotrophicus]UDQ87850.1 efflux RND transporter periplasmic adaptor subunit [Xanthobacter autotrophicus]
MIVLLLNLYIAILVALIWLKVIPNTLLWKLSPIVVLVLLNVVLFIPMGWGAPAGGAMIGRHSVSIVPDVSGEVIDVPATPNAPLKAGDVLFRIDPTPFAAQLHALEAQLRLAETRLAQMTELAQKQATPEFNVEQRQSEVDQLRAQVEGAKWNLDKTTVRAPADGYVTNLALRKGARVSNLALSPAMAFIDISEAVTIVQVPQIYARYIEPGQKVEITFKFLPGQVFSGRVGTVLQAIAPGQTAPSGSATETRDLTPEPFVVRVTLDDPTLEDRLPAGSVGSAAIYTDHVKISHVIRQVVLRQQAMLNYIWPY